MARYHDRFDDYDYGFPPYVSQAQRRYQARQALKQLTKCGKKLSPVVVQAGRRKIAVTFWGNAWCDNLERYSDFANRLPRGRSYLRNGSLLDLQIESGVVTALVSGTDIYSVTLTVAPVPAARWKTLCRQCSGSIDSMIELLQGRFSTAVMEHLCRQNTGLFPNPREIQLSCSCPDWATMCKHVAAVLYGIGARLDAQPELLFRLRQVAAEDLVAQAGTATTLGSKRPSAARVVADEDLAEVFGVELAAPPPGSARGRRRQRPHSAEPNVSAAGVLPLAGKPPASGRKPKPSGKATPKVASAKPKTGGPAPARRKTAAKPASRQNPAAAARVKAFLAKSASSTRQARGSGWDAAARKAVSERMKRYWQERRPKR